MEVTTGGILSRMFAMVKARFGPLVGLWLVFVVATFGVGIVLTLVLGVGMMAGGGMMAGADPSEGGLMAMGAGFIVMMILMYLVYILIYLASYGSMAHMASPLLQPTFGESLGAGVRAALPLLGATLLLGIGYLIVFGTLGALGALAGSDGGPLGVILILLILPVAIYLGCRLSILIPLAAVEGIRNPIAIIGKSWQLTSGRVLSIFGAMLVYMVIAFGLFLVAFLPVLGSFGLSGTAAEAPGVGVMLYLFVAVLVALVLVTITGAAMGSAIHAAVSDASGERFEDTFG